MTRFLYFVILIIWLVPPAFGDASIKDVYKAIKDGKLKEASDLIQDIPTSSARDGNRLFMLGLMEPDGKRAAELVRAALAAGISDEYRHEAELLQLRWEEAAGLKDELQKEAYDILNQGETLRREEILALLAANTSAESNSHKRYLYTLINEYSDSYFGQYARLSRAYTEYADHSYDEAIQLCRRINTAEDDDLDAAALILISRIALERGEDERALLNYNIIREKYPGAIGEIELLTSLKQVSDAQSGAEAKEVFSGITYSIQVGVFSVYENAQAMEKRIKQYGLSTRIKKRSVSGSTYRVVLAGRFNTLEEAESARHRLELGEKEVFKVVVNDD